PRYSDPMVAIPDARTPSTRSESRRIDFDTYYPGPSIEEVLDGRAMLARGCSGDAVEMLQHLLNCAGIQPPLDEDGLFGPKTQAAVEAFQERLGMMPSGRADQAVLGGLDRDALIEMILNRLGDRSPANARAPQFGQCAPSVTISAGSLQRDDEL